MALRAVLIVDDDPAIRQVLEYNLEQEGYAVRQAGSAEEGWESFAAQEPDLVITDVRMAGKSGLDLLARIKQRRPDEPVIVVTAYGNVAEAVEAMKRGAYDYVAKPFDRDALKLTIRKALEYSEVRRENIALKEELRHKFGISGILGESPAMKDIFRTLARVAPTEATVLIQGETGTGKELVARAIHHGSARAQKNFVTVNCAAIPRELMESELFGHEKGSFTGAIAPKTGKFEMAGGGTIFLDEVGDIDPELQKKLLRVLQEREIDTVGSSVPRKVDARVIAATNQPVAAMVESGKFRKDLYYRLNVVPIVLPPLRERIEDIPLLARHFLARFGGESLTLEEEAVGKLLRHTWPGNVRELENAMERAILLRKQADRIAAGDILLGEEAPKPEPSTTEGTPGGAERRRSSFTLPEEGVVLDEVERDLIEQALSATSGNQSAAARLLGISRQTLIYRMQKHGLRIEKGE
jgi:nitrogen regulation protein NR(I)